MQDLSNLKEYQKNSLKVKKIESKFTRSKLRGDLMRTRKYLMDSKELMKKYDVQAKEITAKFNGLTKTLNESVEVLEDITTAMENVIEDDSLAEIKMLQKNAKAQQATIKKHDSDIKKNVKILNKINNDLEKMAVNVPKARKDYTNLKKLYDAEVIRVNEETLPFKKELKVLEATIDKKLLGKYKQITKSHAIALVEMKGRMCIGCNMELPAAIARKIAESETPMECENCGRLLFVKAK